MKWLEKNNFLLVRASSTRGKKSEPDQLVLAEFDLFSGGCKPLDEEKRHELTLAVHRDIQEIIKVLELFLP